MHLLVNAIPIGPGGGLTVVQGILDGLRSTLQNDIRMTVLTCASDTTKILEDQQKADLVDQVCPDKGVVSRQLWQNFRLGKYAAANGVDCLLTINFFMPRVRCPQVVYHLDLARYVPIEDGLSWPQHFAEHLRNRSARRALRRADANVFESHFLRQAASEFVLDTNPNNDVIYIGLPDDQIDQAQSKPNVADRSTRIVAVTNPLPHKDNPTMIRAFAHLVRKRPQVPWKLEIAGGVDADAWNGHRDLARELGVLDRICWRGHVSHTELDQLLRSSLCMLSTSILESFSMVAVESMARGCPAIVSDVASMPESVGDAAVLVPPGDHQRFGEAVLEIYDDPSYRARLIARGYKHIEKLRWSDCGVNFDTLFRSLHNRANRP